MAAGRAGKDRLSYDLPARQTGSSAILDEGYSEGIQANLRTSAASCWLLAKPQRQWFQARRQKLVARSCFMTEQELDQHRREKWHLNGAPLRTLDDARRFIESVGFCLMYPMRPPLLVPTFMGAWTGSNKNLPAQQHAFADP